MLVALKCLWSEWLQNTFETGMRAPRCWLRALAVVAPWAVERLVPPGAPRYSSVAEIERPIPPALRNVGPQVQLPHAVQVQAELAHLVAELDPHPAATFE